MAYELTAEDRAVLEERERKFEQRETFEAQRRDGKITLNIGLLGGVKWVPDNLPRGTYWPGGGAKGSSAHRVKP